jgi:hypothetical protein
MCEGKTLDGFGRAMQNPIVADMEKIVVDPVGVLDCAYGGRQRLSCVVREGPVRIGVPPSNLRA